MQGRECLEQVKTPVKQLCAHFYTMALQDCINVSMSICMQVRSREHKWSQRMAYSPVH